MLRNMEVQKSDLSSHIKNKRSELQKIKDEIDTDDEILQVQYNTIQYYLVCYWPTAIYRDL